MIEGDDADEEDRREERIDRKTENDRKDLLILPLFGVILPLLFLQWSLRRLVV